MGFDADRPPTPPVVPLTLEPCQSTYNIAVAIIAVAAVFKFS